MQEPLSLQEVAGYKRKLLSAFGSLAADVEMLESRSLEPSGSSRLRPDDEVVESVGLELDLVALAADDELGYEIREALERIEDGSFGLCEVCGDWIQRSRLALIPYARHCIGCVARLAVTQHI